MKRLICLTAACAVVFAASATAATVVPTRVSIHANPAFNGLVWSPGDASRADKRACRRGRLVSVFRDKPATDELKGRGHTDLAGRYSVPVATHHGDYYVRVKRKVTATGTICRRTRSLNFAIH